MPLPNVPVNTGTFNTSQTPAKLQPNEFVEFVVEVLPSGAHPMFAMSQYWSKPAKPVRSQEYGYFRTTMLFSALTINGAKISTDTTLTVDSTVGVVPGMIFQVPATREIVRILTVPSATTVTVARASGRVAAGAIADNAVLFCVGTQHSEESERPVARRFERVYTPNYTSILRNAWAVSGTAAATIVAKELYSHVATSKSECVAFHTLDWESTSLWSQPLEPTGTPLHHSTQGLIDAIYQYAPGNIFTAGSTTTFAQVLGYFNAAFSVTNSLSNSNKRVALLDTQAMNVLQGIGMSSTAPAQIWSEVGTTEYGIKFTKMYSIYGEVTFLEDKVLNGTQAARGLMVIFDPNVMQVGYLPGRENVPEEIYGIKDGHANGKDAQMGGILTELVFLCLVPESCVVINNLTAAAA